MTDMTAELLAVAEERGRLVEVDQLLREIVGPGAVNAAHRRWTSRIEEADERVWLETLESAGVPVEPPRAPEAPSGPSRAIGELLQAIRATAPGGGTR